MTKLPIEKMLKDAERLGDLSEYLSITSGDLLCDCSCHIKALAAEIIHLEGLLAGFVGYATTAEKTNQREWLERLTERANKICEELGHNERYRFTGSYPAIVLVRNASEKEG